MIPKPKASKRSIYLDSILDACPAERIPRWPEPTKKDFATIGELINQFSNIDLHMRRMVEALDRLGALQSKYQGKSATLNTHKTRDAILTGAEWTDGNLAAFNQIEVCRSIRNMVAHFAVKRFEKENALLFMTKSVSDFKQAFGVDPTPPKGLMCVIDADELRKVVSVAQSLVEWLQRATYSIERRAAKLDLATE